MSKDTQTVIGFEPSPKKEEQHVQFSFKKYAWGQFKNNKPALYSLYTLFGLVIIAILAPFLANEQPLVVSYRNKIFLPIISFSNADSTLNPTNGKWEKLQFDITDWKRKELDFVIWAPITYSPGKSDLLNHGYIGPFQSQKFKGKDGKITVMPPRFRHWLGTSKRGEDVMAGLIHGTYISLSIGLLSMGIASFIGVFLGAMAGYYGDSRLTTKRGIYYSIIVGSFFAFFYAFIVRSNVLSDALSSSYLIFLMQLIFSLLIAASIIFIFQFIGKKISQLNFLGLNSSVDIPVDSYVSRAIEILISMPRLILIISIAAVAKPSIAVLMIIIGLTSWTGIARFTRAEFLKVRNLDYIAAASALGLSERTIIFRHALPNAIAPVFVTVAFGIASAILIESGLSFLGVGVPADIVTWGALVNAGRENFSAWWLVVFPGFAIFLTVTIYNLLGEGLRDALDPRLKV